MKNKKFEPENTEQLLKREKKVSRLIIMISIAVGVLIALVLTGFFDYLN